MPKDILERNFLIDRFLSATISAWSAMDFTTFSDTMSCFAYDPLAARSWTQRILLLIDDCEKAGLTPAEIARLFPNPSEIRCKLGFDLWMANYAPLSVEEQMRIFDFYTQVLLAMCKDDHFAQEKNIAHAQEEIRAMVASVRPATPQIAKQLGRLVSAGYHTGHALYGDMNPSIVYENYGPYDVADVFGEGHIAAIKEFKNFNAPELWPGIATVPLQEATILAVYKDVSMRMDAASHAMYSGDLISGLKFYRVWLDGKEVAPEELATACESLEMQAAQVFQKMQSMNHEEKKRLFYRQKAYCFKKLHERLGQAWDISTEIEEELRGKPLLEFVWPEDPKQRGLILRRMFDPRIRGLRS